MKNITRAFYRALITSEDKMGKPPEGFPVVPPLARGLNKTGTIDMHCASDSPPFKILLRASSELGVEVIESVIFGKDFVDATLRTINIGAEELIVVARDASVVSEMALRIYRELVCTSPEHTIGFMIGAIESLSEAGPRENVMAQAIREYCRVIYPVGNPDESIRAMVRYAVEQVNFQITDTSTFSNVRSLFHTLTLKVGVNTNTSSLPGFPDVPRKLPQTNSVEMPSSGCWKYAHKVILDEVHATITRAEIKALGEELEKNAKLISGKSYLKNACLSLRQKKGHKAILSTRVYDVIYRALAEFDCQSKDHDALVRCDGYPDFDPDNIPLTSSVLKEFIGVMFRHAN